MAPKTRRRSGPSEADSRPATPAELQYFVGVLQSLPDWRGPAGSADDDYMVVGPPANITSAAISPEPLCRHCGRPRNRHGKMLGGCFRGGKALRTRFEADA